MSTPSFWNTIELNLKNREVSESFKCFCKSNIEQLNHVKSLIYKGKEFIEFKELMKYFASLIKLDCDCLYDDHMMKFSNFTNLMELKINKCPNLQKIIGIQKLTKLELKGCRLSYIEQLSNLINLTKLVFQGC